MSGQQLTLWTIRVSLLLYANVVVVVLSNDAWSKRPMLKWIWAASCGMFLLHVALAFHHYHGWSHTTAFNHTADETERLFGWRFGHGIYFNYVFTLVWVADTAWWLLDESSYVARNLRLRQSVHVWLFLIAFNATVVFEDGIVRWAGVAATAVLATTLFRSRTQNRSP